MNIVSCVSHKLIYVSIVSNVSIVSYVCVSVKKKKWKTTIYLHSGGCTWR